MAAMSDGAGGLEPLKVAQSLVPPQSVLDAEDEAMASELVARYA
jgi:hypothetical protein